MRNNHGKESYSPEALWAAVMPVYEAVVLGVSERLEIHIEDAREAVHKVIGCIVKNDASLAAAAKVENWASYLAEAAVNAHWKSRKGGKAVLMSALPTREQVKLREELPGREEDPALIAERRELEELAAKEVAALPERQREAVTLACKGYSYKEIADLHQRSPATSRSNYRHGIRKLKRRFREDA